MEAWDWGAGRGRGKGKGERERGTGRGKGEGGDFSGTVRSVTGEVEDTGGFRSPVS